MSEKKTLFEPFRVFHILIIIIFLKPYIRHYCHIESGKLCIILKSILLQVPIQFI